MTLSRVLQQTAWAVGLALASISFTSPSAAALDEFSWSRFPASVQREIQAASDRRRNSELQKPQGKTNDEHWVRMQIYQALQQTEIRESFLNDVGQSLLADCQATGCKDVFVMVEGIFVNGNNDPQEAIAPLTERFPDVAYGVFRLKNQGYINHQTRVQTIAQHPMVVVTLLPQSDVLPYFKKILMIEEQPEAEQPEETSSQGKDQAPTPDTKPARPAFSGRE